MTSQRPTRRQFLTASAASAASLPLPALPAYAAGDIGGGKAITLVVSYPAGGGADAMARLIAPKMAEALGQPVIVDNKPGGSGTIAAGQVARAAPDGTTLLLDASSFAVNPALFQKLPYDNEKSFVPIAVLAQFPTCWSARRASRPRLSQTCCGSRAPSRTRSPTPHQATAPPSTWPARCSNNLQRSR